MSDRSRFRARHLYLPYVPFQISIFPQGDTIPSYIERAVLFLIEGRQRAGDAMPIDELIFQLALGEPAGRELINGMWRKGWLVFDGRSRTLVLSSPMRNKFPKDNSQPDFSKLGSGEAPILKTCFFDLITGRAFESPYDRRDDGGRPPYVIQPFYPDSDDAPYGVPMSGFLNLEQRELIDALRVHDDFRQVLSTSSELVIKVSPPDRPLCQRDMRFIRLFFEVERHKGDTFTLQSSEKRYPALAQLATAVAPHISERVLTDPESPLTVLFKEEERFSERKQSARSRGAGAKILQAVERFGQVESARTDDVPAAYQEAQLMMQHGLSIITDSLAEIASRQVEVSFLEDRSAVDRTVSHVLRTFSRQAILASPVTTSNSLIQLIEDAESAPQQEDGRRLLMQTGGRMSEQKSMSMRRTIDRERLTRSSAAGNKTRTTIKFDLPKDQFVDGSVLIGDSDDVVICGAGLLESISVRTTGFHLKLLAPVTNSGVRGRANAAIDLIDGIYPTFFNPSPIRTPKSRRAGATQVNSELANRFAQMLANLGREAEATSELGGDENQGAVAERTVRQLRELSRLRSRELKTIGELVQQYEHTAPVTVTGVSDSVIFETGCALLQAQAPSIPFYIGVREQDSPDAEFIEVLNALFQVQNCQDAHLVFLGPAAPGWATKVETLQTRFPQKLHVHRISLNTSAGYLPFIIGSAGCLVATGGIVARSFVARRRADKTQVGFELKGLRCQEAPLKMLTKLGMPSDQIAKVDDYANATEGTASDTLSSTLYRRWLQVSNLVDTTPDLANVRFNIGVEVLVENFSREQELFEKCRGDALLLVNHAYEKVVWKAGVLAGIATRDQLAAWYWSGGAIFEAAVLAETPSPEHPLSDPDLRAFIVDMTLASPLPTDLQVPKRWLENESVLALVAVSVLSQKNRGPLIVAIDGKVPQSPLGHFVTALVNLARKIDDAPLVWSRTESERLIYAPEKYGEIMRNRLEGFEKDRANKEANSVQAITRELFGPIRAMREWVNHNRFASPGDFSAAIAALEKEFGKEFMHAVGTRGRREHFADDLVKQMDQKSREQHPTLRSLIGPKRRGMVTSIARFLEILHAMAILGGAHDEPRHNAEKEAVSKAARAWIPAEGKFGEVTPVGLLREAALSEGRSLPNGEADFSLWRFPLLLKESKVSNGGARRWDSLFKAVLDEEWPLDSGKDRVFRSLMDNGRFGAADLMLDLLESQASLADGNEAEQATARMRAQLSDALTEQSITIVALARRLELDAAQLGLCELQKKAKDIAELYDGLDVSASEFEEGNSDLSKIQVEIRSYTRSSLPSVIAATGSEPTDLQNKILTDKQFGPWQRRLALAHFAASISPFETQRPQFVRNAAMMQTRMIGIEGNEERTTRQLLNRLGIPDSRIARAMMSASRFALAGSSHADDEQLSRFVGALMAVISGRDDSGAEVVLSEPHLASETLQVSCPGSALETWLSRQLPAFDLRIFFSEVNEMLTLAGMDLPELPVQVFINPFPRAPQIQGAHLLVSLNEILAALCMKGPAEALLASAVSKVDSEVFLPWTTARSSDERNGHLARIVGVDPARVAVRHDPMQMIPELKLLIERLNAELTLSSTARENSMENAHAVANMCLAFLSGGHLEDAYDILQRTRSRIQTGRGPLEVQSFLKPKLVEIELRKQAESSYKRWLQTQSQPLEDSPTPSDAVAACLAVWTADPDAGQSALQRTQIEQHLSRRLAFEDGHKARVLWEWLTYERVLIGHAEASARPNPAHPFASLRLAQ